MIKVRYIKKITKIVLDVLFWGGCFLMISFFGQLFCYTSFKIPSDSMAPVLEDGDFILVNKMMKGARLFDVIGALEGEDVNVYRAPGWSSFQRNDVLVFNFPYQWNRWDSIRMDVMQYYVKRCIALPGDTLEIRKGMYKVRGYHEVLGNVKAQQYIASLPHPEELGIVVNTFPYDEELGWNIREFGPLPIPKKGQEIRMNETNYKLYWREIAWEQKKKVRLKEGQVLLNDSVIYRYRFRKNYYFVSGDNMPNSQDSRYWGLLPEDYIVGKAIRIWNSKDKYTGKVRWERVMKKII